MIQFDVIVNDTIQLHLIEWDRNSFAGTMPNLKVASDDFTATKEAFESIDKLQILRNGSIINETTEFTSYATINYLGSVFCVGESQAYECMQVVLTRSNLVEQVDRLNKAVFDEEDPDSMDMETYRQWLLKEVGKHCRADIYQGSFVRLSDGTKHFTYDAEDQQNIQSAVAILLSVPEVPSMPYHADGEPCYMMPREDLFRVYLSLHLRLVMLTTRCNYLNMWIKNVEYEEELRSITYESELPPIYQDQYNEVLASASDLATALTEKYIGSLPDELIPPEPEPEPDPEPEHDDENAEHDSESSEHEPEHVEHEEENTDEESESEEE